MRSRTKLGLQTLLRTHAFLESRSHSVSIGELRPQVDALGALIKRLEAHAVEQSTSHSRSRAATDTKNGLGRTLYREYLLPLSRVARGLFVHDPTIRRAFDVPDRRDVEALIQRARAVGEIVAQHLPQFVAKGIAADIVERLTRATDAVREAQHARSVALGRRASASEGMVVELAEGRRIVGVIDAMLAPRLESEPDVLKEWRVTARFRRRPAAADETESVGTDGSSGADALPGDAGVSSTLTPEVKAA